MLRKLVRSAFIAQRCCSTAGRQDASQRGTKFGGVEKHLENSQKYEQLLSKETASYEEGVRYLAHMMGKESGDLSDKEIQEAISYLFPSSLYSLSARPIFMPPSKIIPKQKNLQCSMDGRPFDALYYTRYPNYYNLMHEAVELLHSLKRMEDENIRNGCLAPPEDEAFTSWQAIKDNTFWCKSDHIKQMTLESISDEQYQVFLKLMDRVFAHPYSYTAKDFLMQFRQSKPTEIKSSELPELQKDEATGRSFATSYGQRKMAFAEVRIYKPGTGELRVNEGRFLEAFSLLSDREQVITPLVFTGLLGEVDVELAVSGSTETSRAGAARLAIARALTCFLDDAAIKRLRLAGLLTMDMRFREKKKSGMPKARKTYIWKRR